MENNSIQFYIAPSRYVVVQTNLRSGTTGDTLNIGSEQFSSSGMTPSIYVITQKVQSIDKKNEYEKYLRPAPLAQQRQE